MNERNQDTLARLVESVAKLDSEDQDKVLIYASAYADGKAAGVKAAS